MNHPSLPHHNPNANVHNTIGIMMLSYDVTQFITDGCCCDALQGKRIDFSYWRALRVIEIGSHSFQYVTGVDIIGLNRLERVVIGENCFTKRKDWYNNSRNRMDPNRRFYLKNCERLRELKMGRYSFMDYSVCEIENDEILEVIEMGQLNESSCAFYYASLALQSDSERMK